MLPRDAYVDDGSSPGSSGTSSTAAGCASGRSEALAEPGDQRAESLVTAGVFLIRDAGRGAARLRQRVPPPQPRAAAVREHGQPRTGHLPLPRLVVPPRRVVWKAPGFKDLADFDPARARARRAPVHRVARAGSSSTGRAMPARSSESLAELEEMIAPYEPERLRVAGTPRLRRERQLEDPDRELPGVLPLPGDPPGAVRRQPAEERRQLSHPTGRLGRRQMDLREGMDTMSLDGRSGGHAAARPRRAAPADRRSTSTSSRTCYQPAPRLRHDPPADAARPRTRTRSSAPGRSPPRTSERPVSTPPTPSTSGTSRTNRTGRPAIGAAGLSSTARRPGPWRRGGRASTSS